MTKLSTIETLSVLLANTTMCIILIYLIEIKFFVHISNTLWSLVNDYKNSMLFEQEDIEAERQKVEKEYQLVKKEGNFQYQNFKKKSFIFLKIVNFDKKIQFV